MDYLKKSLFNKEYNEADYNKMLLRSFYYYERLSDNYKEEYNEIFNIKPEDLLNYNLKGGSNLKKKIKKSQYQFLINLQYNYLSNYYYPNNFITIKQIENAFNVNYKNDKKITIEERLKDTLLKKHSLINIKKQNTDLINNIKQILQNLINNDTLQKFNQIYYNKLLVFFNDVENIFLSITNDNTTDIYTETKQAQELYDKLVDIKSSLEQIKKEIETNKNYMTQYNSNNLGVSISKQIDFINTKLNDIKTNNIKLNHNKNNKNLKLNFKLNDYYTKITNNKELREKYEKITKELNDEEIDKLIEKYKLNLEIKRKIVESFSGGENIEKLNELYDLMIIDDKINKVILSFDDKLQKLLENVNLYEIVKDKNIEIVINEFKTEERKAKEQAEREAKEQAKREAKEQGEREQAERKQAKREAKEQGEREQAEREQAEREAKEQAEREAKEQAEREQSERKQQEEAERQRKQQEDDERQRKQQEDEKADAKPEEKADAKPEKKTEEEKNIDKINCENITKFKQNQNDCWLDTFFVVMTSDELNNLFKMFLNKVLEEDKDLFNSIINYIEYKKETDKANLKKDFVEKFVKYYNNKIQVKIDNDIMLDKNGNGGIQFVIELINKLFDYVKLSSNTDFDKKYFIYLIQNDNDKITEITDNNYTLKAIYYPQGELHYEGYYKCNNKWLFYDNQKLPIEEVNIDNLTQKSETYLFFVRNEDEETKNERQEEEKKDNEEKNKCILNIINKKLEDINYNKNSVIVNNANDYYTISDENNNTYKIGKSNEISKFLELEDIKLQKETEEYIKFQNSKNNIIGLINIYAKENKQFHPTISMEYYETIKTSISNVKKIIEKNNLENIYFNLISTQEFPENLLNKNLPQNFNLIEYYYFFFNYLKDLCNIKNINIILDDKEYKYFLIFNDLFGDYFNNNNNIIFKYNNENLDYNNFFNDNKVINNPNVIDIKNVDSKEKARQFLINIRKENNNLEEGYKINMLINNKPELITTTNIIKNIKKNNYDNNLKIYFLLDKNNINKINVVENKEDTIEEQKDTIEEQDDTIEEQDNNKDTVEEQDDNEDTVEKQDDNEDTVEKQDDNEDTVEEQDDNEDTVEEQDDITFSDEYTDEEEDDKIYSLIGKLQTLNILNSDEGIKYSTNINDETFNELINYIYIKFKIDEDKKINTNELNIDDFKNININKYLKSINKKEYLDNKEDIINLFKYISNKEYDNQTGGKIDKIIENMVNEYNNKKVKKYKIVKKLN